MNTPTGRLAAIAATILTACFTCPGISAETPRGLGDTAAPPANEEPTEFTVELKRLVYGASKYQQDIARAPASVSIVTAEEIQRYGYQTLADILRGTAGLYVTNDRNYSFLGFR